MEQWQERGQRGANPRWHRVGEDATGGGRTAALRGATQPILPAHQSMKQLTSGDWNRGLVIATRDGLISGAACNLGLRLSVAVLWSPNDGRPPGLYWSVEAALAAVGV